MPRRHQGVSSIVAFSEKNQAAAGERKELADGGGDLFAGLLHQCLGGNAFGKGALLEGLHFRTGNQHANDS